MNTIFTQIHIAPKIVHLTKCPHCTAYSAGPCACIPGTLQVVQLPLLSPIGGHAGIVDKEPA